MSQSDKVISMIEYYGPLKCSRPAALQLYEDTGKYIIEPKFDGMFCIIEVDAHGVPDFFTRGHHRISRTFTSPLSELKFPFLLRNSTLLGELEALRHWSIERNKKRGFSLIDLYDIFRLSNKDLRDVRHAVRYDILYRIFPDIKSKHASLVEQSDSHFVEFFERYKKLGYEGCVLKEKNANALECKKDGHTTTQIKVKEFGT